MNQMRILLILSFIGLFSCSTQKNNRTNTAVNKSDLNSNAETKIRECFDGYKSAILNDQGSQAVDFVDSRTITYYADILESSKNADSSTVDALAIMDKLMVLSIRHRTPPEDLHSFDSRQLLEFAIKEGMVGKNSVANNEIGKIKVDDKFATGQLVVHGNPAPAYFHFYEEQGSWKLDLTALFPMGNKAFQQMADESGQEENEYLLMLLEMITGELPTSKIWNAVEIPNSNSDISQTLLVDGFTIESGPYGKGHGSYKRIATINDSMVMYNSKNKKFQIPTDSTNFKFLISKLQLTDVEGSKNYFNPGVKDGSYVKITTGHGVRMFTNVFSSYTDLIGIKPDSIGVEKYVAIWNHLQEILKNN